MKRLPKSIVKYLLATAFISIAFPAIAFAGALIPGVPVEDALLEKSTQEIGIALGTYQQAFKQYTLDFQDTMMGDEDLSIRTLLSLNPNPGVAAELYLPGMPDSSGNAAGYSTGGKTPTAGELASMTKCNKRKITNPLAAMPSANGAWQELLKHGKISADDNNYSSVEVNDSTSLTCLMQEIVEQNKLQINLQIHTLLRDYINSALSALLVMDGNTLSPKSESSVFMGLWAMLIYCFICERERSFGELLVDMQSGVYTWN